MLNFKSITQTLLEIFSKNKNPRWPHGGYFGFLIGSKIEPDLSLICTNKCAQFQINCSNTSWDIECQNGKTKWLLGGHFESLIESKIKLILRQICTNKCAKFQINCSLASWDIEQNSKSKMTAWWPYWISYWVQNGAAPSFNMYQ